MPIWEKFAKTLAPFPVTTDSVSGKAVIGSQDDMDPRAFPSKSFPGNARYPIVFFMAIHPGEGVSLSSDPVLLERARNTVDIVSN